ncbi:MAG TPA: hypothetical protein VI032_20705 [Burkholderiaceae bacterium]
MSTHTAPRQPTASTAVSLRRWLCAWLALLTLAQMLGSTLAGLHGGRHHHRPTMQAAAPALLPVVRWRHGEVVSADAHTLLHAHGEAHDHAATDASVLPIAVDAASEAVAQLTASLAPGGDLRWSAHDNAHHVQAGTTSWAPTTRAIAPPLKPPRG